MPWRIEYRETTDQFGTKHQDAYAVGPLDPIRKAAFDTDLAASRITVREGHYRALGFMREPSRDDLGEDYWGTGPTREEAFRFMYGAVLDPREGG